MTTDSMTYDALIDQLSAEHAELLPWIDKILELAAGPGTGLRDTVIDGAARIRAPLEHHIAQEDDVLFPAYAQASGGNGLVAQFEAEHREILALRDELLAACESGDGARLGSVTARFAELLGDHMRREDMMLFPSARETLR